MNMNNINKSSNIDSFLESIKDIEPSNDFRRNFWNKVSNLEQKRIFNRMPIIRFANVSLVGSFVVFIFLIFSVLSPILYSQDIKIKREISRFAVETLNPMNNTKIFSLSNFINYCDEYCKVICGNCKGSDMKCKMSGVNGEKQ